MRPPGTSRRPDASGREGSVYLMVLCSAVLVGTIGVCALLSMRIQRRADAARETAAKARVYAQAVLELAHERIAADPNWRDTYDDDKWTDEETWGECTFRFKLDDEADGSLDDDSSQPARLYAKATVGSAVRIYSVLLRSSEAPNLLANADFEDGTTHWAGSSCLLLPSVISHGGSGSGNLTIRTASTSAAYQQISGEIVNGRSYYVEAWARALLLSTEKVSLSVRTSASGSGTQTVITGSTAVGSSWTKVSGTLTPTWSGALTDARWQIFSYPDGTSRDFRVDDAVMKDAQLLTRRMSLIPGTWRQEMLP